MVGRPGSRRGRPVGSVITGDDVRSGWSTVVRQARTHVERLLARLPDLERAFIEAMAGLDDDDDRTLTRIAHELGYDRATQLGPTAQRLDTVRGIIDRGRRYSFRVRTVEAYLQDGWP